MSTANTMQARRTHEYGKPIEALQLDAHGVDAVFARDVLMYTSPARVAAECARVLHPRGRAVAAASETRRWNMGRAAFVEEAFRQAMRELRGDERVCKGDLPC